MYLDDILVFSRSRAEHREHLQLVIDLLRKHKLYAKLSECKFEQPELQFLGYVISGDSVKMDPRKTAVVKDWILSWGWPTISEGLSRAILIW